MHGALAVALRGVTKVYDSGVAALGPLDLAVDPGAFVALLGPSGCGKSTALRLIAGLMQPSAGTADAADAARLGVVFQEPTLMPWADIADNVALPLRLAHVPADDAQVLAKAMLARVGLGDFAQAYPRELSGGMKMRAALARALVTEPDVLLLDEPFAALDEITRFRLNDDLLALWQRRAATRPLTVLFVTHSVFESVYLAQRVVVMTPRPGRIAVDMALPPAVRDTTYRASADYAAQCGRVSAALAQAADDAS